MGRPIHRKLVLPGDIERRGGLTIYVPRGHEDGPRTIVGKCHICDASFGAGEEEAWQRHVGKCARKHIDEIREAGAQARQRDSIFDEDAWDPEWAEHQRELGVRMLREGRLVARPNER